MPEDLVVARQHRLLGEDIKDAAHIFIGLGKSGACYVPTGFDLMRLQN